MDMTVYINLSSRFTAFCVMYSMLVVSCAIIRINFSHWVTIIASLVSLSQLSVSFLLNNNEGLLCSVQFCSMCMVHMNYAP